MRRMHTALDRVDALCGPGWSCGLWALVAAGLFVPLARAQEEVVGQRPYEMEWAGRTEDVRPALVDFENLDGWTVETQEAEARFVRSRKQQLWGKYVGLLVYRGTGPKPVITVRPPQPVAFSGPVDCVNFWVYGNNWGWAPDPSTPQVGLHLLLRGRQG